MIVVVDYDMGNVGSIVNMLKKIGAKAVISGDPKDIGKASRLILPGVGAFDHGMTHLSERGLIPLLTRKALEERVPVLGICLGMQLLSRRSEEGQMPGLGWVAADTIRFRFDGSEGTLKVPHMGWNTTRLPRPHPLFAGLETEARFYFVHSYHVRCDREEDVVTASDYGFAFHSSIGRDNIMGTQFHPEKSHRYGMKLLENFVNLPV
jgi:glutamine amidotransferase